jgi:putative FmdB family regulatory protein
LPTYSYRCTQCGHAFDIHQAFTDDTLTVCPNCAGTLRKVFTPVGVTFSGSGFYRNDSRAPVKAESKGESAKSESPKSESPKSESKKSESTSTSSTSSSSSSSSTSSSGGSET